MTRNINCFFVLILGVITACGTTAEVVGEGGHLPRKKPEELLSKLDSLSSITIDNFYSKINTKYQDSSQNISFKTSLRIVNDSAVNANITFASIPIINALITTDSLKIVNRKDKCFMLRDLEYFKEQFGVDFSYENIEELFLGKPVAYDTSETYFKVNDNSEYTICSHRKKEIKKNERQNIREIITYYTLDDSLSNLEAMRIISPEDSTMIEIIYKERELVDVYYLPKEVEVVIYAPKQTIRVSLEYRKSHVERSEGIYFVIPESYEVCE